MLMSWVFSLAYASVCAYALVKTSIKRSDLMKSPGILKCSCMLSFAFSPCALRLSIYTLLSKFFEFSEIPSNLIAGNGTE